MNNKKKYIAGLMIRETKNVIHSMCREWLKEKNPNSKITFRVGNGLKTYCRRSGQDYAITYGMEMVARKMESKSQCSQWTTGNEILKRNYFDGDLTIQNILVHTCLHEYAHLIQFVSDKYRKGSVHNSDFYKILDRMYMRGIHILLKNALCEDAIFSALSFSEDPVELFSEKSMEIGSIISFKDSKGKEVFARVKKRNKKTVTANCEVISSRIWKVPYGIILSIR